VPTIVEYSLLYNSKKLNETLDAIIIARKIVRGMIMCEMHKCVLQTFFVNESTTPYNPHVDPEAWPKTCNNKLIW